MSEPLICFMWFGFCVRYEAFVNGCTIVDFDFGEK